MPRATPTVMFRGTRLTESETFELLEGFNDKVLEDALAVRLYTNTKTFNDVLQGSYTAIMKVKLFTTNNTSIVSWDTIEAKAIVNSTTKKTVNKKFHAITIESNAETHEIIINNISAGEGDDIKISFKLKKGTSYATILNMTNIDVDGGVTLYYQE